MGIAPNGLSNTFANPELIARVSADLGLDQPLPVQYLTLMKKIFTGQLTSYASAQNVTDQIWRGLPATLSLTIGAGVLWMVLAVVFGYMSAVHAGRFTDRALTILSLVGISMPVFWLAAILLYFFTFKNKILFDKANNTIWIGQKCRKRSSFV